MMRIEDFIDAKRFNKIDFRNYMRGYEKNFQRLFNACEITFGQYEETLKLDENFWPHYKKMSRRAITHRIQMWRKLYKTS